ncbi:hypothetical protein CAEBREN_07259 [Caenorhabditis brenneri]|uniref:Uncharacterized protein n=1 Tax=Caenorhabditis brenneri TaxID=135651 RepID=G0MUZ3_CAEBE|nr:hypothetical protein CAEBREN_07259 [Caenorhabditis brenneri]
MPILKQYKHLTERCADEVYSVVKNSSKKAVLLVPYNPDIDANIATKISPIVDKYGKEIDIYSMALPDQYDIFVIVDKDTVKMFHEDDLESVLKERYGIEN